MSESHSTVEYRDVVGFPGYRVGNDGSVWSCWKKVYGGWAIGTVWKRRRLNANDSGHMYVHLFPRRQYRLVHRLVLEAFVGPCPEGMQACHFPDRDPANNHLENLRWDTCTANHNDQIIHGTDSRGERNPAAKLRLWQAKAIREEYASGTISQDKLARKYGVAQAHISRIVLGRVWIRP